MYLRAIKKSGLSRIVCAVITGQLFSSGFMAGCILFVIFQGYEGVVILFCMIAG
jgi:hypothetical protein